jgi:hypothetical protein
MCPCRVCMRTINVFRRMFPTLRYRLSGLEPNASYAVFLELSSGDDARYKFQVGCAQLCAHTRVFVLQNGRWIVAGRAEPSPATGGGQRSRVYAHPDSPAPGRIWMRQALSFHRVKLTNNMPDPQTHVSCHALIVQTCRSRETGCGGGDVDCVTDLNLLDPLFVCASGQCLP